MVLDSGKIVEFDSPQNLLASKTSIFFGMAKDAGLASDWDNLTTWTLPKQKAREEILEYDIMFMHVY